MVPGGRAPEYIRNDLDVQRIIAAFFSDERPVAQICHGPLALAAAGVLQGRRSAAYPPSRPTSPRPAPNTWMETGWWTARWCPARAWPDHPSWMREFMRLLRQHAPVGSASELTHVA